MRTATAPMLTISDIRGFAKADDMIELVPDENRLALHVSRKRLAACGLKASAQLLSSATIIEAGCDR